MYTELPQKDIIKAIKFAIDRCKKHTRRSHVTLEKKKRGGIRLGKSAETKSTHVTLSFKTILKYVNLILKTHSSPLVVKSYTKRQGYPWDHLAAQTTQYVHACIMNINSMNHLKSLTYTTLTLQQIYETVL